MPTTSSRKWRRGSGATSSSRPRLRSPRAWLLTVAYRQFLDHRARWPVHVSLSDHDPPGRDWSAVDPAALAERSDEARILDEAVNELPEVLRSVIVLHYTGGLSLRETAEALGISAGTVKSRLNPAWNSCGGACHEMRTSRHPARDRRRAWAAGWPVATRPAARAAPRRPTGSGGSPASCRSVEPLSAAQRALWTSVSTRAATVAAWPTRYRRVLLAAAAAAVVLAVGVGDDRGVPAAAGRDADCRSTEPSIARLGEIPPAGVAGEIRELDDLETEFQALLARRRPAPPAGRAPRRAQGRRGALAPLQPNRRAQRPLIDPDSTMPSSFLHTITRRNPMRDRSRSSTQTGPAWRRSSRPSSSLLAAARAGADEQDRRRTAPRRPRIIRSFESDMAGIVLRRPTAQGEI